MSVIHGLYLILLAGVAGYILIGRVPSLLHTPMLSGSNFIHGIVLAGAMLALSKATGSLEITIGFVAVAAAAANVVGGFVVTDRMLKLFDEKDTENANVAKVSFTRLDEAMDEGQVAADHQSVASVSIESSSSHDKE